MSPRAKAIALKAPPRRRASVLEQRKAQPVAKTNGAMPAVERLGVRKTYKLYIGGEFPRTESGRAYEVFSARGDLLANACRGTRKDIRDAVRAARTALPGWSAKTAFNRFDPTSPFGGYKESGYGREGGIHGLGAYLDLSSDGANRR